MSINRRQFIRGIVGAGLGARILSAAAAGQEDATGCGLEVTGPADRPDRPEDREDSASQPATRPAGVIQTVRGPIPPGEFGPALPHEHVMCDFIGADKTGRHRWDREEVVEVMRPYLMEAFEAGVRGFVDCTPMFLGRDPEVLARLSELTGLHILTNTGMYKEPFLPAYAFQSSADELAAQWIQEFERGIEGTVIRPGFIKIAVNPGPLVPIQQTIVRAAARTSRATGMVIACHTGHGRAAGEALDILEEEKVATDRFIFVHAGSEPDQDQHFEAARRGAWIEYDHLGPDSTERSLALVTAMLEHGHADRLLLSHDAGWYRVGEPGGGKPAGQIRGFTYLFKTFLPLLKARGVAEAVVQRLIVENPARAFMLGQAV